jgi:hypothetical protein
MNRPPLVAIALVLAITFALGLAWPSGARGDGTGRCTDTRSPRLDRAAAFIRSRTELEAWLAVRPVAGADPLVALSPPARARFLASLRFGPQGLASFQSEGIRSELTATQAWRLLALFGLQSALAAMPGLAVRTPEDAEIEAWRRRVSLPEAP